MPERTDGARPAFPGSTLPRYSFGMDYVQLRNALYLTQSKFADLAGGSQLAVAAGQNGRRSPTARVAELYRAIVEALSIRPTIVEVDRGRTIALPSKSWNHFVQSDAETRLLIHLAGGLRWSSPDTRFGRPTMSTRSRPAATTWLSRAKVLR